MKPFALRGRRLSPAKPSARGWRRGAGHRPEASGKPSARRLEAPHRRLESRPRLFELFVVRAYRAASWVLGRVPPGPAALILGLGAQLSYLAWPAKRRWSNANFGHVLGLPPDHPRVRRVALAAYRHYGRYIIEVMRLPRMTPEETATFVRAPVLDAIERLWKESPGGLIFVVGHLANVDAVAAGVGARWRVNVVADDSAYTELFEDFRRQREQWGNHVIPWRNLREIYQVLKDGEMLALLVDWGYRADGIPVRMFDAWTTLPAGPATLAARTRSVIVPVLLRRGQDHPFAIDWTEPITVPSTEPAELASATQRIADALAASIAAAPAQWYSFKPIWPDTPEEQAQLAARAAAMLAATPPAGAPEPVTR